ncbi:MAG: hypothetical protein ABW161_16285 [Candidatus Thiodiazotropha sp.]
MRITINSIAISSIVIAIILFVAATIWMSAVITEPSGDSIEAHEVRVKYLTFKLDVYKTITIGFLVAILGLLIPNILPEAKYKFELLKEGRRIYSKAKTGIDYFRFELADLNRLSARAHIHEIHEHKHIADEYDIPNWEGIYRKPYGVYKTIMAYLDLVENTESPWDTLTFEERRSKLLELHEHIENERNKYKQ